MHTGVEAGIPGLAQPALTDQGAVDLNRLPPPQPAACGPRVVCSRGGGGGSR